MSDDWQVVEDVLGPHLAWTNKEALAALARLREREAQFEEHAENHVRTLEARVAALEEALREIAEADRYNGLGKDIARRALAHEEETNPEDVAMALGGNAPDGVAHEEEK